MTLPVSGPISLAQIQAEFGGPNYALSTYYRGAGYTTGNNTSVPTSGQISMSQFRGAVKSVPGSTNFGPGSHSVVIPVYSVITMYIWGAGGGGGGISGNTSAFPNQYYGGTGGTSYFGAPDYTIYAYGGTGGGNGSFYFGTNSNGVGGSPGGAANGNIYNTTGGGRAGGAGAPWDTGFSVWYGGSGAYGGLVTRQWIAGQAGAPVPGQAYSLVIGSGGAGGYGNFGYGSVGQDAVATLQWT